MLRVERLDSLMAIGESRGKAKEAARASGASTWAFSTGKIHSFKTRQVYQPAEKTSEEEGLQEAAATPTEELLAGIWSQVLRRQAVGRHQDFFALGGHSLLLTQMLARVRSSLGVEVPLRTIFEAPTIAALAQAIDQGRLGTLERRLPPLLAQPRQQPLAASFLQERAWFLYRQAPGNTSYHLSTTLRVRGPLHVQALEESLRQLVQRHESLRTTFAENEGRPVQVIAEPGAVSLTLIDLKAEEAQIREALLRELVRQEIRLPYDLGHGPLWRVRLWRLGPQEHVLLLGMHHIISDAWSLRILTRELMALYHGYTTQRSLALPDLPVQYADYVLWQRSWLQGEVLQRYINYWQDQLANPTVLELPIDIAHPAVRSYQGAQQALLLPSTLVADLEHLCQQENVTLFMILLSAFALLLSRYSGQQDILIGAPTANRTRAEIEHLIGLFAGILALRVDLSGQPTFQQLLARVRKMTLEAYTYQDVPFENIVRILSSSQGPSRTPLFRVFFNMLTLPQDVPQAGTATSDVRAERMPLDDGSARFDLTFYLVRRQNGLLLRLVYDTDLFTQQRILTLLHQFHHLLAQIAQQPTLPIDAFSLERLS